MYSTNITYSSSASDLWIHDYFLSDHLGNVRVVITSDPNNTTEYWASMEENRAGEENLYFENVDVTRADRPYNYPDKNVIHFGHGNFGNGGKSNLLLCQKESMI